MSTLLPPFWLIRAAVASVWLYEGFVVQASARPAARVRGRRRGTQLRPAFGVLFLKVLGVVEVALAVWALSAISPVLCALAQTLLLVTLNANGLIWARHLIHDPAGMVVKNIAFLVLVWVSASLPGWQ